MSATETITVEALGLSAVDSEESLSSIRVNVNYTKDPEGEALYYRFSPGPDEKKYNMKLQPYEIDVHNARGLEHEYSLDKHGFQFAKHEVPESVIQALRDGDDETVKKEYYPVMEELIKSTTGASRVVIDEMVVRKRSTGPGNRTYTQPALSVHSDEYVISPRLVLAAIALTMYDSTAESAEVRLRLALPDEADALLKKRYQTTNVWRPLLEPIEDWPFCVCDYGTVGSAETLPMRYFHPDHDSFSTLVFMYNAAHKWYYLPKQKNDEVVFVKTYDSKAGVASYSPHVAFDNPYAPKDAPLRESVEARALIFWD